MVDRLLIDREQELAKLRELLREGRKQLVLLYGRRRVGKTFLLTNAWPSERTFYFTASATTPEQNRRQLITDLAQWSGQELRAADYQTWRTVFRLLLDVRAPEPFTRNPLRRRSAATRPLRVESRAPPIQLLVRWTAGSVQEAAGSRMCVWHFRWNPGLPCCDQAEAVAGRECGAAYARPPGRGAPAR